MWRYPTPLFLARLMDTLAHPGSLALEDWERAVLLGLIREPDLFAHLHGRLLTLATEARVPHLAWDYLADAAESAEQLDRLLAACGWRDPAAVIGEEVDYEQILLLLEARIERGEGDPELLRLVERRLRRALEAEADERSGRSSRRTASVSEHGSSPASASLPTGPAGLPAQTCRPGSFSPGKTPP